VTKFDRCFYPM